MRNKKLKIVLSLSVIGLIILLNNPSLRAQVKVKKEAVIRVDPNIIALPQGDAAKIPVVAARVRSTQLRDLNKQYNAVKIEKLYKLEEKTKGPMKIKGIKGKEEFEEGPVDLATVFTTEIRKEMKAQGNKVVELKNTFLIYSQFFLL